MDYVNLLEVVIGGGVDGIYPADVDELDLTSDQLDLFDDPAEAGTPKTPPGFVSLGRMGEYHVFEETRTTIYRGIVFVYRSKAVAFVELKPYTSETVLYPHHIGYRPDLEGTGYRVGAVWVDEDQRGRKLAREMYVWLLTHVCDYLMADDMQTPDGVRLWKALKRDPRVGVMVWDSDRYMSRNRRTGKDFDRVYEKDHLVPWVALKSKISYVETGNEDD